MVKQRNRLDDMARLQIDNRSWNDVFIFAEDKII